jgi:hypothetical protein
MGYSDGLLPYLRDVSCLELWYGEFWADRTGDTSGEVTILYREARAI